MNCLADSDFLFALYKPDDSNHREARLLYRRLEKEGGNKLYATNLVIQEVTTVVSKRMGMDYAREFFDGLSKLINRRVFIDQSFEDASWKIFLKQTKKGTSFVDCANMAAVEKYKFDRILSFDKFYPKELRLT